MKIVKRGILALVVLMGAVSCTCGPINHRILNILVVDQGTNSPIKNATFSFINEKGDTIFRRTMSEGRYPNPYLEVASAYYASISIDVFYRGEVQLIRQTFFSEPGYYRSRIVEDISGVTGPQVDSDALADAMSLEVTAPGYQTKRISLDYNTYDETHKNCGFYYLHDKLVMFPEN